MQLKKSSVPTKSIPQSFPNPFRKRSTSHGSSSHPKHSHSIDHIEDPVSNHKKSHRRESVSSKNKEPITLFQLWRELCDAEQKILHHSDLNEFIKYLKTKGYINYSELIPLNPPDDQTDEYNLMAKIKIDAQLEYINELFLLKKTKFLQQQKTDQDKKQINDLYKTFEEHYIKKILIAKKHLKNKILN